MPDDPEREDHSEEGEYHFSDEGEYTPSLEEEEMKAPEVSERAGFASKFAAYKRFLILGGAFGGILLVVYIFVAPPVTVPPTEITAGAPPALSPPPIEAPKKMAEVAKPVPVPSKPSQPILVQAPAVITTVAAEPNEDHALTEPSESNKTIMLRMAALEAETTKGINQLHEEYATKLAEFQSQDKAVEEEIKAMTTRLTSMETEMNQLLQALKQPAQAAAPPLETSENASANMPPHAPKVKKPNYTVQAIIPGRAWLKTDNGETITVAEGDVLKSFGRITKIDPYDGVIQVDTGSTVVTLTYGNGEYV